MPAVFSGYVSVRLRVVPHYSSGIVERAKRERAWKSPTREGRYACRLFSRGVIITRARVSLPLLSLRKNGGLLVVCVSVSHLIFIGVRRHWSLVQSPYFTFTLGCIYFVPRFVVQSIFNRSFLSSKNSHFENECENEFYLHDNKNHFHNNGFARSLALKQRLGTTRKWPIHTDALVLLVKVMLELFITFNFFLILMCVVCRSFVAWSKFFSFCSPGSSYQAQESDGARGSYGPKSHISCEHQPAWTRDVRDSLRVPKWKEAVRI